MKRQWSIYWEEHWMSKKEINALNRKLTTNYLILDSKNSLLKGIKETLNEISSKSKTTVAIKRKLQKTCLEIDFNLKHEYQLDLFKVHFEEVHPKFFESLLTINDQLTNNNLKLAAFIKMGFNNKEIAFISHLSIHAVKKSVQRLREKLNLLPSAGLRSFIHQIEAGSF